MTRTRPQGPSRTTPRTRRRISRRNGRSLRNLWIALPIVGASALFAVATYAVAAGWMDPENLSVRDSTLQATGDVGFRVQEVLVAGRNQTDRSAILDALGVKRGDPILSLDPRAAHARISALPWIKSASVERRLPDTVLVRLEERAPVALWQHERRHRLIDRDGTILADQNLEPFAYLPLVVGPDAPAHAQAFLETLGQFPEIADLMEAAIRVGGRRWDLRLNNGIEVRLPENSIESALQELTEMKQSADLFERDVVTVDLRLTDRLVIQTSPIAAERRRLPEENT